MNKRYYFISMILVCTTISLTSYSMTLKDKFLLLEKEAASEGYFIVTEHQKNYTFLRFHSLCHPYLILEEISIPAALFQQQKLSWSKWIEQDAPGSSSWIFYKIQLEDGKLHSCYSFTKESFLALDELSFLPKLLVQQLDLVEDRDRKKIGPQPSDKDQDNRKLWNPPKIFEGKRCKKAEFLMYEALWPYDQSELSNKKVHLYFDKEATSFPFPYWMEVGDGYNRITLRVVDSGKDSHFLHKMMPSFPPSIHKLEWNNEEGLTLFISHADAIKSFEIVALLTEHEQTKSILLPFEKQQNGATVKLSCTQKILKVYLEENKCYKILVMCPENPSIILESEQGFLFK